MDNKDILELEIISSDHPKGMTIKQYLSLLLTTLWIEEDVFNGKRPFGNSCWQHDVYGPLVKSGAINGIWEIDEDGYPQAEWDDGEAEEKVLELIEECFK